MGYIVDELGQLLARHVQEHGLVTWFDPERHYETALPDINIPGCRMLAYEGSYYALRAAAEPFIRGDEPPKLLVYLSVPYDEAEAPISELLTFGETLRPGGIGARNTKLAVVARRALKGKVAERRLADLDRQVEKGQLTLRDLESLAKDGSGEALPTVLAVLFRTSSAEEAALAFLANPSVGPELISKSAVGEWYQVLNNLFGLAADSKQSPDEIRAVLGRQVLVADLLDALGDETPSALTTAFLSKDTTVRRRCAELASGWRNRRDFVTSYCQAAAIVEKALHLDSIDFSENILERVETFPSLDRRLLRSVAAQLAAKGNVDGNVAEKRRIGFWAEQQPDLQAEWTLVTQAGQLMRLSGSIEARMKDLKTTTELISAYTQGPDAWCEMDSLHRLLEKRASSLEFALNNPPEEIERLINRARQRYSEVAGQLAETFLRIWSAEGFHLTGYYRQANIFERFVAPECRERKTAYILVDALRFELARELPKLLGKEFEERIECVVGTAPSITEVGMAALLPGAGSGLRVSAVPRFEVSIHGQTLSNRQDRMDYLHKNAGVPVIDLKLEEPSSFKRKLKELGSGPGLVVLTSREIDQTGEDQMTGTREHMERVLSHICLALRRLAENGVERFVIAADHGHVFGTELAESEKIESPSGKGVLLHRRVWLGRGGKASDSYLYTNLEQLGVSSDLDIAVPWNLAGFRTSGPTAYFHGGLSPQEIILPVVMLTPTMLGEGHAARRIAWDLALGSSRITTRFLSVRVTGQAQGLFETDWPMVQVEVLAAREVCSVPVSSTYGYREPTGEVAMRRSEEDPRTAEPNTITLMLTGKSPTTGIVSVRLLDAVSGVELAKVGNVEVSIAI